MAKIDEARYRNFQHYITEGWAKEPKHIFRRVGRAAAMLGLEDAEVLDIGCATGELISYLAFLFPDWRFTGIDIFEPLIKEARSNVPQARFLVSDFLYLDEEHHERYDLICAIGVISLFEDEEAELFWDKACSLLKPGGTIIILGPLNEFGIDMILRHRKWMDGQRGDWERGWSIPSRQSIEMSIGERFDSYEIEPYEPQLDLPPRSDPIRTWTVAYGNKRRQLTNGLKLLVDYYLIVAQR